MRPLPPLLLALLAGLAVHDGSRGAEPPPLKLLFLGDNAGHQPAARFELLRPVFAARNISLTYTDKLDDLNAAKLNQFDGLMVYANHTKISPEQEKALLEYVGSGKGFIPVHCASYCFLNSPAYVDLVGAQFRSHTTGTFRTTAVAPDHPVLKGYRSFTSWDETYVHHKHNEKDRTLLEVREEAGLKEPWTWTRTHGKGRVFYTAWGHDQRTWNNPGFHNLLERGVRWACGQDPALAGPYFDRPDMTQVPKGLAPFEYVPAKVPFYPGKKGGGKGEPLGKMQKPLPPAESVKHYVTPVGFEVRPFVTEEKLGGKPLAMAWDEKGRLWVSVSLDYPNELKPAGQGRDRIVVCTDTDGDGVCDTVTTFADKLSIVTSLLPYAGGVIAHQAPVTLFLKDTDGDGVADVRQELIRGWSTGDTHAGPSNLRYGFDNWVYGAIGYAGFNGEVNGERVNFRQGFYRFKVEADAGALKVTKLEFLRSTNNNTWGLNFDESGELFGSTANGCPLVHMPIPNRYTEKVRGLSATPLANIAADNHFEPVTENVRQVDWHGGFTAASHVALYTARTYPREYWGRTAFLSEPTGHLTATFTLRPNGATFAATYGWNLLASDDEWAAPIDAQVGPDGNVWVNDWYNFIVQHNPTPAGFKTGAGNAYETELRDKKHGRIYRVVHGGKADAGPKLAGASPAELVAALKHPNLGWRLHAQRLLVERGQRDVEPALLKLVQDQTLDETGLNAGAVHAVWTLSGLLGPRVAPEGLLEFVRAGVTHPSAAVRRASYLGLVAKLTDHADALLPQLTPRSPYVDADVPVRVAALMATADLTDAANLSKVLASHLSEPTFLDPFGLPEATAAAGAAHPLRFLSAVAATPKERTLPPASAKVVELVARTFATNPKAPPAKGGASPAPAGAAAQPAADPSAVEQLLRSLGTNPKADDAILAGLAAGWPAGKALALTQDGEKAVGDLLGKLAPSARGKLLRFAAAGGVKGLDAQIAGVVNGFLATVADAKAADADRIDAAKAVVDFRPDDGDAAAKLLAAVTPQTPAPVAAGVFEALAASRSKAIGPATVGRLRDLPAASRPAALRLVLGRPDSAAAFLDAVEKGQLRFDLLALDQKTALANNADKAVAARAQKLLAAGGGLPSPDRQKVIDELHHVVSKTGDVAKGKTVFTAQCAKCHTYAGEGTQIGPDLTGMAVHPKEELLIHILDPSRSVEGNYKAYRVVTSDGRSLTGLLAGETKTSVEVVDAEGKRHPLSRDDIESLTETEKSLMPEGFEKQINPTELTDLLEFLTQKGKYVPVPLDRVATIVTTKGMFFDESGIGERLVFPDWKPKVFNGVPFVLVDPQGDKTKNAVLLYGPNGKQAPTMPKSVSLPYAGKAKAVHLLSGIGGWNSPAIPKGSVSMTVRLRYEDGKTEDHDLVNGVHFADYIRRVDVPGSQFAFAMRGGQQVRYLAVTPRRPDAVIRAIEFVKGPDASAPVVMAVTVESP